MLHITLNTSLMRMNNLLILLFAIAIFGVYADGVSNWAGDSKKKRKRAISNHLPLLHHETFAYAYTIATLHRGRHQHHRKLAAEEESFQIFPKSSKAADAKSSNKGVTTKSAKAYSKGQKEDDSSLFTSCSDVQAELAEYKAAATAPSWLFVQMADMCTLS